MCNFVPDGGRFIFLLFILVLLNMAISVYYRFIVHISKNADVATMVSGPSTAIMLVYTR